MKKRLLAALLVICLALTLLPAYALADDIEAPSLELLEDGAEQEPSADPPWVYFNPQGGVVTIDRIQTNSNCRLDMLPTPFRKGYTFDGWYDIIGLPITMYSVFKEDTTAYARWQFDGEGGTPGGTEYAISIPTSYHGKVVSFCDSATCGSVITLTVTPDSGYELKSLKVRDRMGAEVELTKLENGEYSFKMPASSVTVSASFSKIGAETPPVQPGDSFTDVPSDSWYHDAVYYVNKNGMMYGTSTGRFSPGSQTSRAMIVTILYRMDGTPPTGKADFTDVAAGQWYTDAVAWASANDIVYGYDNVFRPDGGVTREQAAAILYRYTMYKGRDTTARADLSGYSDSADISDYALEAMQWANAQGLIKGSNGRLSPNGKATRAEIAEILMRFYTSVL